MQRKRSNNNSSPTPRLKRYKKSLGAHITRNIDGNTVFAGQVLAFDTFKEARLFYSTHDFSALRDVSDETFNSLRNPHTIVNRKFNK